MTYHRASLGTEPAPLLFFEKSLSVPKTLKFSQVFGCITFGTDKTDGNSQVCCTARPNGCGGDEGRGPAGIPSFFFFSESHKVFQISFLFWYVQKTLEHFNENWASTASFKKFVVFTKNNYVKMSMIKG